MKLDAFLAELGSKKGAPGGGAAAALAAAAGAALVEMVARLNAARLKRASGTAGKAALLRGKLQRLIREDAKAFGRIQKAYKLRKKKPALWQSALKSGARPPLRIVEYCAAVAKLAQGERKRTNPWLESDRREALILLRAAAQSAWLNVEINLKSIDDKKFVQRVRKQRRRL